jgi:YihY family inner membrane protein
VNLNDVLCRLDSRQQRRRPTAFVAAVIKKYSDDQGPEMAGLIAFYGFVSLFPLLLVLVTVLGFVLSGDPDLESQILNGTLGKFPILSDQLKLHSLEGSGLALAVGIAGALFAGLRITTVSQNAFNKMWGVPLKRRPDFFTSRLRGLRLLVVLGALLIVSTTAAGFVGTASHGALTVVAGIVVSLLFNVALFLAAFNLLTAAKLSWRELLPGALVAALGWQVLQGLGGFYAAHVLKKTQPLYGVFALVLGLLAWLYLGSQLTVLAAEANVVRVRRLWPRSLFSDQLIDADRLTDADRRALAESAAAQERVPGENVDVSFEGPHGPNQP